ncbi:MAG: class I SAM-dependent methyltransferase [Chloroflexota bacterium]
MKTPHGRGQPPDEKIRRQWQDPEAILADIGLEAGLTFMDIGCGEGFFALPAARRVGETGTVYGVDTNGEAISRLKEKAAAEGFRNLKLVTAEAEATVFCRGCADIVFFGIDLHDFREPGQVLANARRMLKPGGKLVDLDWKKEEMTWGPPLAKRFSQARAVSLIEAAGFRIEAVSEVKPYHYLITARP